MKNFVTHGQKVTVVAAAAIASGAGVLENVLFGVATKAAKAGESVDIQVEGVVELTKVETEVWSVGEPLFWDDTNKRLTKTSASGLVLVGCVYEPAANPSTVGQVRLNGSVPATAIA